MARPPARAAGRSGLLTEGESGKPKGFSPPSPKGYSPTSPARPAGGRAATGLFAVRAAGQVSRQKYSLPHTTPPERGSRGGTSSPGGSFPHFFPRNGAPAGQAPVPRRSNGVGETPQRAPLREPLSPRSNGVRTSYIPHPGSHPLPNQKHRRAPQAPAVFFSARRKRPPQSPISRSRFTISTALRAQS